MSKKVIWLILGLISAAVIGVVILQLDLIRTGLRVNEERFDKGVFASLSEVAQRLEEREEMEAARGSNGFNSPFGSVGIGNQAETPSPTRVAVNPADVVDPNSVLAYQDQLPLEERVDLEVLDQTIRQEMANHGIEGEFEYAVFSKDANSFIIKDGYYTVQDDKPINLLPGHNSIYNSKYEVTLFDKRTAPPGRLIVHFPNRQSILWSSLWLNFAASLFFAVMILLCFGYTIMVILRQKKVSEMKTDFINNMTHEFKTPIATISMATDNIVHPKVAGNPEKVGRFINIIKQENKRMNKQVEKVLQMAKLDKQELRLSVSKVDLHELIEEAVEYIGLRVEHRDGRATAELNAADPIVEGDETHLASVINNLLDNADKYSPEQPTIVVTTRNRPGGVEITVKDNGIGMTKESRKHIFDRFYRVHTGNIHDVKGFGLGLSYVKKIMDAHHASVNVRSELGKGSSFILFIPHKHTLRT
ncbi:MAG: HAMP domain-containing sensor histidine kinase [Saprospiraceae bacterium]